MRRTVVRRGSFLVLSLVALAGCKPYVVFAGGDDCAGDELRVEADDFFADGAIHSNGDLVLDTPGTVKGKVTAAGSIAVDPALTFDPAANNPATSGPKAWPSLPKVDDYRPGGSIAAAAAAVGQYYDHSGSDLVLGTSFPDGVYYTDGDITVAGVGSWPDVEPDADGVTLVAEGRITVGPSGPWTHWHGDPNHVLAMTSLDSPCTGDGITIDAPSATLHGGVFAPRSAVAINVLWTDVFASTAMGGRIVGYTVEITAETFRVAYPSAEPTGFLGVGCAID